MTHQIRKWATIIIVSVFVIAIWGLLAWKVFQLVVDEDYNRQPGFKEPIVVESPIKVDVDIDMEKIDKTIADKIHQIVTITDRINQGLKKSADNDSTLDELYLMNVEDDEENNRYVATVKWPNLMPNKVVMEVKGTELFVTAIQSETAMVDLNEKDLMEKLAESQFKGVIELPGPGLNTGTRYIVEDGILMMFIPKKQ